MTNFSNSKTSKYILLIQEHVIAPLDRTLLATSCYATCMMLFGCIDGLGRLVHTSKKARVNERFKHYLSDYMGGLYATRKEELWQFRNSLDHNSIAALTFLSRMQDSHDEHLSTWHEWMFINTGRFLEDFRKSLEDLISKFKTNSSLLIQAESRLQEVYIPPAGWRSGECMTTPPPGITFIS